MKDENILKTVFSDFIFQIRSKVPVNRKCLINRANNSSDFQPILADLKQRFPEGTIYKMFLEKVRNLGLSGECDIDLNSQRLILTEGELLNLSDSTQKYFQCKSRRKSILLLKQDFCF